MKSKSIVDIVATAISQVTQPPLVVGFFFVFLMFYFAPDFATGLSWCIIAISLIGVAPTIFTLFAVKLGHIKNVLLTRRQDRSSPFLIATLGAIVTFIIFYRLSVPAEVLVFLITLILILIVILIINLYWKISVHATTITVVAVAANIFADYRLWYLFLLIPIVCWSRVYRKKHTVAQVVAGTLLNGIIVYITFNLFGVS
ncbi:MAG TPA: hypothetical protein PLC05_02245 [bacterium]|nr:hypothetical protein [bacterium]HOR57469.1 hypothetical protein [bacterium]HPL56303.1 hypothetical protein [bacterium]